MMVVVVVVVVMGKACVALSHKKRIMIEVIINTQGL